MERTSWLRGGSLIVAMGALAAMVLHACASTEATSPPKVGPTSMQQAAAEPGSSENGAPRPTPPPPPNANPAVGGDDDDPGPYMPATKAGPGIVLSKKQHADPPSQKAQ